MIGSKVSYRSVGTTGDPVTETDRITTSPARAGTGEPLHRLEPVPVRWFTGYRFTGWSVQHMTIIQKSQNEECWTLSPNPRNTHSAKHEL